MITNEDIIVLYNYLSEQTGLSEEMTKIFNKITLIKEIQEKQLALREL